MSERIYCQGCEHLGDGLFDRYEKIVTRAANRHRETRRLPTLAPKIERSYRSRGIFPGRFPSAEEKSKMRYLNWVVPILNSYTGE